MMSETEIREMIAALKKARNRPCDCYESSLMAMVAGKITKREATDHTMKCKQGGRMMDAAIDALLCVLGGVPPTHPNLLILEFFRREKSNAKPHG